MTCTSPIEVCHPDTGLLSQVRCGQCLGCRIRRKQSWVGRLRLEQLCHLHSRFITLTYAVDPGVLDYRDFQLFMKRYRESYGPCRFFAVGEYGERNARGHWHAIIFGHPQEVRGHWKCDAWTHGFSYDGECNVKTIGYVAGYVMKGGDDVAHRKITRCSLRPGIGFDRVRAMAREAARIGICAWPTSYRIGGRYYPLCDGGLACFKTEYAECGGVPLRDSTPMGRDLTARASWLDWGTRHSGKEASYLTWRRDHDEFAAKKARK